MKAVDTFIRRPVFATTIILTMVVLGIFSFMRLGVDIMPKVDFPIIIVTTELLGASPEEVETEISKRIEESVNTIAGLDEIQSFSYEGRSQVVAQFVLEKNSDVAAQEVRDRVNRVINDFPEGTKQPVIEKFDIAGAPIVQVVVSGTLPMRDLTRITRKRVKEILETVNGIGDIRMIGSREREIHIQVDPARLAAHDFSIFDVETALQKNNVELPGGYLTEEPREITVRTMGKIVDAADFGAIPVQVYGSTPVLVRDIATVEDTDEVVRSFSRLNGEPCINLSIRKQSDANTVEVAKLIGEKVGEIAKTLPPGVKIQIIQDQSLFILSAVHSLEEDLILGAILVALTVFIFIRSTRGMLICAISIPVSLISTFTLMKAMGFTLNNLTLLALTLANGIVIDDAIIVFENIFRHLEEKREGARMAASTGLDEISMAVVSTTLSLLVIFVPLAFMQGIVGRFMLSFGLTMAFAIGISLIVAFVQTPMLCSRFLKIGHEAGHTSRDTFLNRLLDRAYTRGLKWVLSHRKASVAFAAVIMLSSVPAVILVGKDFYPQDDRSEFNIHVKAPEGTSIAEMDEIVEGLEERLRSTHGVVDILPAIGGGDSRKVNEGDIFVKLVDLKKRNFTQFDVMNEARAFLKEYPSLRASVQSVGGPGGGEAMFQMRLTGPSLEKLKEYADRITSQMRAKTGFVDVDTSLVFGKPELRVNLDRQRAADLGVTAYDVARTLQLLVSGDADITKFKVDDELYEVRIRLLDAYRSHPGDVRQLPIPATKEHMPKAPIRLDQIADFEETVGPSQIDRYMRERSIEVDANLDGLPTGKAQAFVLDAAAGDGMEPGYRFQSVGHAKYMKEMMTNFTLAFVLSIIFMYMILAALFESWVHPVTILFSLPMAFPFAILSLLITGKTLHIISILGLFLLIGIVKKNAILQVDYTNTLRKRGMARAEALIEASRTRLRPILMTTSVLIVSMIPVALSRGTGSATRQPMAIVIIGGQLLCLAVTLLLTPVFYSIFDDAQTIWVPRWWRRLGNSCRTIIDATRARFARNL
ncbi:MAG: efflux RND transporter permease subunit [Pseudomonadota bacterium]